MTSIQREGYLAAIQREAYLAAVERVQLLFRAAIAGPRLHAWLSMPRLRRARGRGQASGARVRQRAALIAWIGSATEQGACVIAVMTNDRLGTFYARVAAFGQLPTGGLKPLLDARAIRVNGKLATHGGVVLKPGQFMAIFPAEGFEIFDEKEGNREVRRVRWSPS